MSSSTIKETGLYFAIASAIVILPWGIPFILPWGSYSAHISYSALLSLGGFLILLGYTVVTGRFLGALGILLVPCVLALLVYILVYRPDPDAFAECPDGATQVQKAQNQNPRHIILEGFDQVEMFYGGTEWTSVFAIVKGAEVLSREEGGSGLAVHSVLAKPADVCEIPESEKRKGEYADRWLTDSLYFAKRFHRIDRCLVSRNGELKDLDRVDAVIFRMKRIGGNASSCQSISVFERDNNGQESSLGIVKYDFGAREIYPQLGSPSDKNNISLLYLIAVEVFGEEFNIHALDRHIVD